MKKDKKDDHQPLVGKKFLSTSLPVEPSLYMAAMHLELQKFTSEETREKVQLTLGISHPDPEEEGLIPIGLKLSQTEGRVLSGLQKLFHNTEYKGNLPPAKIKGAHREEFHTPLDKKTVPRISFTFPELYEACDVPKRGSRYSGPETRLIKNALITLETRHNRFYYKRRKGKAEEIILTSPLPLIFLEYYHEDLTEGEQATVRRGKPVSQKVTRIDLTPTPIFTDQIDSFHVFKASTLHRELQSVLGSRYPACAWSFIEWLWTKNWTEVKIRESLLGEYVGLSSLVKTRQRTRLEEKLKICVKAAEELEYLLDHKREPFPVPLWTFYPNPERCWRVKKELERQKELADANKKNSHSTK